MHEAVFHKNIVDKAIAAYSGLAIGDALGATVEFMTPNEIAHQYGQHNQIIGGGWLKLAAGKVTDDTEMSLALGQALLGSGVIDAISIAEAFSDWMRTKPVDIGNTVRRGIVYYRRTGEVSVVENKFNAGNGACMRCLPIALFTLGQDWDDVIAASKCQAHITHNNPLADFGTEHIIDLVQMALMDCSKQQLKNTTDVFVEKYPAYRYNGNKIENPSGYIVDTLQAVFQAFYSTSSFEECLVDVVNRGGDADTTGAIAGMLAGAYYGIDSIPRHWLKKIDQEVLNTCSLQARQLIASASQRLEQDDQRSVSPPNTDSDTPMYKLECY